MLTVKLIYLDGHEDIKDCWDISDVCLDGVSEIRVIRDESKKVA
jgi:hypothetical protein